MWLLWALGLCVLAGIVMVFWAHFSAPGDARGPRMLGIAAILLMLPAFVLGAGDLFGLVAGGMDMVWHDILIALGGGVAIFDGVFRSIRKR
jgi:hypothetical protein